jgi:hypothetical protein
MKHANKYLAIMFLTTFILTGTSVASLSWSNNTDLSNERSERTLNGQILFSPLYGSTTYLIDSTGAVNHTWSSTYFPGEAVCWLGDGTILRTIRVTASLGGGVGGGVQKVKWDGTVVWDFRYNTNGNLSHHDIKLLPNGNILLIAWETKTRQEAIAAGRNPSTVTGSIFMPDHIIEVKPTGPTSGDIVWEWHAWDHLIQDFDSSKANYGVVKDHPELININFGTFFMDNVDWLHTNSIDYNPEFDQILLSVHNFDEIWVIDHSTSTAEATGHTGGRYGKGGDLLYRWGNPQAYDTGNATDHKLFSQHDASWIKPGCPGEGHVLVFNNGGGRPNGQYSSVDEIATPVNSSGYYFLETGSPYGPENLTWSYTANPPTSFFSYYISGAERLKDGDTLICDGVAGRFFEVTPQKTTIWEYVNPYPTLFINDVFKIVFIYPTEEHNASDLNCEGSISWTKVGPGATMQSSFQVQNIGSPNSSLSWKIASYPDWGIWSFDPGSGENLTPEEGTITVLVTVTAPDQENTKFEGFIHTVNNDNPEDYSDIPVSLKTPVDKLIVQRQIPQFYVQRLGSMKEKIYNFLG